MEFFLPGWVVAGKLNSTQRRKQESQTVRISKERLSCTVQGCDGAGHRDDLNLTESDRILRQLRALDATT